MKEMRIYNDVTNVFQVCITPSYVVDISDVTLVVLAKSYCFLFYMCRENRTLKINKKLGIFLFFFGTVKFGLNKKSMYYIRCQHFGVTQRHIPNIYLLNKHIQTLQTFTCPSQICRGHSRFFRSPYK